MSTATAQEPGVFSGHKGAVVMAAFAADDNRVVTASSDQTAKLWDVSTGAELQSWNQHTGPLYCLAVSADGRTLVTGAQDNTLRVWDLPLSRPLRRVNEPGPQVEDFTFSPDGQMLLSGSADSTVRLVNLAHAEPTVAASSASHVRNGHQAGISAIAYRSDGVCFASSDSSGRIIFWSPDLGTPLGMLQSHSGTVSALAFSANNQLLLSAGDDGVVRTWQLTPSFPKLVSTSDDQTLQTAKTSESRSLAIHEGAILSMASFSGGGQVVTVGLDGQVVLTNVSNGNKERIYATAEEKPTEVAVRPDNQRIAAGCESGVVLIWNAGNGEQTLQTLQVNSAINGIAWSPDNRKLAVSTAHKTVHVFGPTVPGVQPPAELVLHQRFTTEADVTKIRFSPDSRFLWTSLANGRIDEWGYAAPEQRRQFNHGGPVYGVAVSRDGGVVVSCSADQSVRVWDTVTGQQKFQLNGHQGAVHAVAMSPDETFAVSSGADGTLRLWDIDGGRQLKQLTTFDATMYSVTVHPAGAVIAAAGADRKVHVLDMISGIEQQTLTGHSDYIHCVAFHPSGEQLLSYGYAGHLKFWNTADGRLLRETQVGRIGNYAQFSPDGHHVVVANGDGTARVELTP